MSNRDKYRPGSAHGGHVEQNGPTWTLVLVRDLKHPPTMVWQALTDPAQLREWAPFDVDRSLATTGTAKLSTVGTPTPQVSESIIKRAEEPKLLEYSWGPQELRWELKPHGDGTRLTLWHNIDRGYIAWGAAGWHICFDVLDRMLSNDPLGRIVAGDAMKFEWQRLVGEYAKEFGVEAPSWPGAKS